MSQYEIYKIIKELGGIATTKQIKERAKQKFPEYSLHLYIYSVLKKLEKHNYVKRTLNENNEISYEIIDEWQY